MRSFAARQFALASIAGLSIVLAACGGGAGDAGGSGANTGKPQRGGTVTYLLEASIGTWQRGLDPATVGLGMDNAMHAIYGGLFWYGADGKITPGLATGYEPSDGGKTWTITLREGVTFQDGTPFNAEAVAWNIKRDLEATCSCNPEGGWPPLAAKGITTPDDHTVVLHFTQPDASAIPTLINSSANTIASPTAVREMGEKKFKQNPVGAGPFKVVENVVNSKLVLKAHDGYWKKGRPYLEQLVLKTIGGDQPAYQALQAGQAEATTLSQPALIQRASQNEQLTTTRQPGGYVTGITLNTEEAPFDNKRAREALYYATNPKAINTNVFNGMYTVTQSFTGPASPFHMPKVPGYRTYNLAKAKQIVNELGGLQFELMSISGANVTKTLQALKSQWAKAGIEVTIKTYQLPQLIESFEGKWQAFRSAGGAFYPTVPVGLSFRFGPDSTYTGVHDPKLTKMIRQAGRTLNKDKRADQFLQIAKYISDQAYAPWLWTTSSAYTAVKGVHGPGFSSPKPYPRWADVWIAK